MTYMENHERRVAFTEIDRRHRSWQRFDILLKTLPFNLIIAAMLSMIAVNYFFVVNPYITLVLCAFSVVLAWHWSERVLVDAKDDAASKLFQLLLKYEPANLDAFRELQSNLQKSEKFDDRGMGLWLRQELASIKGPVVPTESERIFTAFLQRKI